MHFAVPGDLDTPSGGYAYARALLAHAPGLRLVRLPGGFPRPDAAALAETARILGALDAPVLVDGLALGALPAAVLDRIRVPVVALCHHPLGHETGLPPAVARALIASERQALARATEVVVTSPATARTLAAEFGVAPARLTVAEPGLDPAPAASRQGRPPVILSLGALIPRKGHDVLIAALDRLDGLDWQARIVGNRPDPDWAAMLETRRAAAATADRITLSGPCPPGEVPALYAGADLFCLPSRYEGYGMVFAEAMMRGLPVIAARTGAAPDLVPPSAGVLVPRDDPGALAAALGALLADRARADGLARGARRHAATLPGWPDTTARVMAALARAAAHGNDLQKENG